MEDIQNTKPQAPGQPSSLDEFLDLRSRQDTLRFAILGHLHDGKTTLLERLASESRQLDTHGATTPSRKAASAQTSGPDTRQPDRPAAPPAQGATTEATYRYFSTPRRNFMACDAPGHEHHTRNAVAAASLANIAVIVVDASIGLTTQTRRHARLAALFGVRRIALAINKMDAAGFDPQVFREIERAFLTFADKLTFEHVTAIPISALHGDNIATRSHRTPWYAGPTLLAYLETVPLNPPTDDRFVFPVQLTGQTPDGTPSLGGTVASGHIAVGDEIRVTASGQTARVKAIITLDGNPASARSGAAIRIVPDSKLDAARGDVLASADAPLEMTDQFEATLIWTHEDAGLVGRSYDLKLNSQWTDASITSIKHCIDVDTGTHESRRQLRLNDIATCNLALGRAVVFDAYRNSPTLGGFILVDRFSRATVAAGLISHNLRRAQNIHRQALSITRNDRERLNGHKGKVIWFTGYSGSGKSTVANALEKELHAQGRHTYILDGDNIRQGLNRDLGFTDADRVENIRRVAEVAKLMMDAGLIVMTAFISPFRAEREMARQLIGKENFVEVFMDTPLDICEQRDPKGLYKKARAGQLPNMTGINSPYERPTNPEITFGPKSAIGEILALISH